MSDRRPRVFVIAPRQRMAAHVARALGYAPHGREVVLISRGNRLRGVSFTDDDHIVWAGYWESYSVSQLEDLDMNLRVALMTGESPTEESWAYAGQQVTRS